MNKVLVEVFVPSANLTYDAYIPLESKIWEVADLLSSAISDLSNNEYKKGRNVTICNFSSGKEYDKNMRVFEANIDNGTKIMII